MARGIRGLPRLQRKLERLRTETAPRIQPVMEAVADKIVGDMRSLVPVDEGDLRKSIGWTWGEAPKRAITLTVVRVRRRGRPGRSTAGGGVMQLTIYAGNAKAFYARWIEFGTKTHIVGGRFKGAQHPGISPRPFFFPSFRANKRLFMRELRKAITQAIRIAIS